VGGTGPGVARARLAAQGLTVPTVRSPEEVVTHLLAVQAQDLRAARLAVRSRSAGLTAADVDDALTVRRTLVVDWLCRGTLHLVAAADHAWLHALTTPRLRAGNRRRLGQEGVGPEDAVRGVGLLGAAVAGGGVLTRGGARALLDAHGVPTAGQALVHLLFAASLDGLLVRGPVVDGEQAFVDPASWIGTAPVPERDEALARLAGRYLAAHAPATDRDLAVWAGITLGDARRGLSAAGARPAGGDLRVAAEGAPPPSGALPSPRLLGGFDPVLHGWRDRTWVTGGHAAVVTVNGVFRPTALVGGRVVATWGLAGGRVTITPREPVPALALRALVADAADVHRFLGVPAAPPAVRDPAS
jgi:hypothetical protein